MSAFSATNEDIKSAAAFALGRICIGNLDYYLPGMLNQIKGQVRFRFRLKEAKNLKCAYFHLHQDTVNSGQSGLRSIWISAASGVRTNIVSPQQQSLPKLMYFIPANPDGLSRSLQCPDWPELTVNVNLFSADERQLLASAFVERNDI